MKPIDDSIPLETDLLRTFLAVARHRNVTRAANAIHRTQSAVSVQIKRLEEKLGTPLFRREARGVSLTEAGERLQQAAGRIVQDLDRTVLSFRSQPLGGVVRVGIPDEYGSQVLPGILAAFTSRHPAVEVFVRCGFSIEFPEAVEEGELDVAVFARECSAEATRTLFEEPTVWVCSRGFSVRSDEAVPLALFDRSCWWRDSALVALEGAHRAHRVAYSSESVAGVKAAIAAGLAVGVLARSTVEPSMQILGEREGFPPLPKSALSLIERAGAASHVPTALVYSSRTREDVIGFDELDRLAGADPSLRVLHTLTRSQPPGWTGYARRIDGEMLSDALVALGGRPQVFICGPTLLVEAAAEALVGLGLPAGGIKTERFGPTGA